MVAVKRAVHKDVTFGVLRTRAVRSLVPQRVRGTETLLGIDINKMALGETEMRAVILSLCFVVFMTLTSVACASPCSGVDRQLSEERKAELAPEIAKQLNATRVDVLQSFRLGRWSIVYVDTHQADEAFLFFADDPLVNHYVTLWSGAASKSEEKSVKGWVVKNAPGIPHRLASCFAWHVTRNRDL